MHSNGLIKLLARSSLLINRRHNSIVGRLKSSPVLISSSRDVYINLAIEHWLYNNLRFTKSNSHDAVDQPEAFKKPIVFMWIDDPCVVIGRHQNPWTESCLAYMHENSIGLARRHSGGGCVYHDNGNINISIIGHRDEFENRQQNLQFISKLLRDLYKLKSQPTSRHDLVHTESGFKISGSAAKLGRYNCYHHFTLLVDVDKKHLRSAIRQKQQDFIKTNATTSRRADVVNLSELVPSLNVDQLLVDLTKAYTDVYTHRSTQIIGADHRINLELDPYVRELSSWEWVYGKTPKFLLNNGRAQILVNKGRFESAPLQQLDGVRFTYKDAMTAIAEYLDSNAAKEQTPTAQDQLLITDLFRIIHDAHH